MNYQEMIEKALKGRSVNSVAKTWGIPQSRLDRYVRGVHMPDYTTGLKIAKEAGINTAEAFEIFAAAEENHRVKNFKLQMGFARSGLLALIAAMTMAVTLFLTPHHANAANMQVVEQSIPDNINYAKYAAGPDSNQNTVRLHMVGTQTCIKSERSDVKLMTRTRFSPS